MLALQQDHIGQLWIDALAAVKLKGARLDSRDGGSTEVIGAVIELTDSINNVVTVPGRKFSAAYAAAEMLWYLSGENTIERILPYAPQYARFAENGVAHGAYGNRWSEDDAYKQALIDNQAALAGRTATTQIAGLIQLLHSKPNTRQAVLIQWNAGDLVHALLGDRKDLPCTLAIQFFVRDNLLLCCTYMRSNDLWLGTPYDIFCFTTLQAIIADVLNLAPGPYTHHVGSLHFYDRNVEKIDEVLGGECRLVYRPRFLYSSLMQRTTLSAAIIAALDIECEIRTRKITDPITVMSALRKARIDGTILADLVLAAGSKWLQGLAPFIINLSLQGCARP